MYLHHNVVGAYCRPANCIYCCYCSLKYPNLSHFHCFDRLSDAMSLLIQFDDLLKLVLRQLTENWKKKKHLKLEMMMVALLESFMLDFHQNTINEVEKLALI